LKQIIIEEVQRVEEIKNDAVKLATMQDQMNQINGGGDDQLIIDLSAMCDEMIDPINRLSDGSMQGALLQSLEGLKTIVGEIDKRFKCQDNKRAACNQHKHHPHKRRIIKCHDGENQ